METRIEHYDSDVRMQQGVEHLSDEGWVLQRLTKSPGGYEAEFAKQTSIADDTPPEGIYEVL